MNFDRDRLVRHVRNAQDTEEAAQLVKEFFDQADKLAKELARNCSIPDKLLEEANALQWK